MVSVQIEQAGVKDCKNMGTINPGEQPETTTSVDESHTAEASKSDIGSISSTLPLHKSESTFTDATHEKVIGEISYSVQNDQTRNEMSLEDIPPNVKYAASRKF